MRTRLKIASASALLMTTVGAFAHEGHGLPAGGHWHATDSYGFAVVALLAALAIWLARGK